MSWGTLAMYAVAALLCVVGVGLLLSLTRPAGPAKIYVYRMAGIMALAAGVVLGFSATATWNWGASP